MIIIAVALAMPPGDDTRVQQQTHGSAPKSRAMASLTSSESQSVEVTSWPRSEPRPTRPARRVRGTTLATGVPARLITISPTLLDPLGTPRQIGLRVMDAELCIGVSSHESSSAENRDG